MFLRGLGLDELVKNEVMLISDMLTNYGITDFNPSGIVDTDYATGGWKTGPTDLDKYFVINFTTPRNIIEASIEASTENPDDMWTYAIYGIDYSDDNINWLPASQLFSIETGEYSATTSWASVGGHQYWRVYVVQSKVESGDTSGEWVGGLRLFEETMITTPDAIQTEPTPIIEPVATIEPMLTTEPVPLPIFEPVLDQIYATEPVAMVQPKIAFYKNKKFMYIFGGLVGIYILLKIFKSKQ